MTVRVSVVIATYNRARLLEGALEALASQVVPEALEWEIVVVDNNSSDATARVITAFASKTTTPVRHAFEPRQGLANARNRGIREARGAIVAFTDDDVLPAPDWVAQMAASFERWSADGVGGRILPRWEAAPPRWLSGNRGLLDRLAIMDYEGSGLLALPLGPQPQVWGANMAFRRELFDRVGDFDTRLGIVGTKLFRDEETDLINRALRLGLKIAYDSTITVFHRIGTDRMQKAYFRKLMFDAGQGRARATPVDGRLSFLGAPLALYRFPLSVLKWAALRVLRRPEAFDQELGCFSLAGQLSGYWESGSRTAGRTRTAVGKIESSR